MPRISEDEARSRRAAYARKHTRCWCIIPHLKGLDICLAPKPFVHHITGGRLLDAYEQPENYFPLTGRVGHDHHLGWGHGQDPGQGMTQREARLWCFALKYILGEVNTEQAKKLMRGRGLIWWEPGMGEAWELEHEIEKRGRLLLARIRNLELLKKHLTRGGVSNKISE